MNVVLIFQFKNVLKLFLL